MPVSFDTFVNMGTQNPSLKEIIRPQTPVEMIKKAVFEKAQQVSNSIHKFRASPLYIKYKVDDLLFYSFSAITAYHSVVTFTVSALFGCFMEAYLQNSLTNEERKSFNKTISRVKENKVFIAFSAALTVITASKIGFSPLRYLLRTPSAFAGGYALGACLASENKFVEDKANAIIVAFRKACGV